MEKKRKGIGREGGEGYEVVLRGPSGVREFLVEGLPGVALAENVVNEGLIGVGAAVLELAILRADRRERRLVHSIGFT